MFMKYIIIIISSIWLMSCSEEFASPTPPIILSGTTVNNQRLDQNPVINLSNGDSLIIQLTMLVPNGISDVRIEAFGLNDFGSIANVDITETATITSSPGDSIYTDFTVRNVVNNLDNLPRAVGSTTKTNFSVTMIDSEFLTARVDFEVERQ